jgi:hypothetical protein
MIASVDDVDALWATARHQLWSVLMWWCLESLLAWTSATSGPPPGTQHWCHRPDASRRRELAGLDDICALGSAAWQPALAGCALWGGGAWGSYRLELPCRPLPVSRLLPGCGEPARRMLAGLDDICTLRAAAWPPARQPASCRSRGCGTRGDCCLDDIYNLQSVAAWQPA